MSFQVFGSSELYLRYLCVLWSGEDSGHLGVTSALREQALQSTKTHLAAMSAADAAAIVQSSAPGESTATFF